MKTPTYLIKAKLKTLVLKLKQRKLQQLTKKEK